MATAAPAGVNGAWSLYRQCAATSAFHKSQLETFTKISLWLGITGAVIGTVAQRMAPDSTSYTSKVLGVMGLSWWRLPASRPHRRHPEAVTKSGSNAVRQRKR